MRLISPSDTYLNQKRLRTQNGLHGRTAPTKAHLEKSEYQGLLIVSVSLHLHYRECLDEAAKADAHMRCWICRRYQAEEPSLTPDDLLGCALLAAFALDVDPAAFLIGMTGSERNQANKREGRWFQPERGL
jgi:hypothetical protein